MDPADHGRVGTEQHPSTMFHACCGTERIYALRCTLETHNVLLLVPCLALFPGHPESPLKSVQLQRLDLSRKEAWEIL
jgi:hypothetical protein